MSNEPRAASELVVVILNNMFRVLPGEEPPHGHGLQTPFAITGGDFIDEQILFGGAFVANRICISRSTVKLNRGLDARLKLVDTGEIRTVFVPHREIIQEILDRCFARFRSLGVDCKWSSKFGRRIRRQTANIVSVQLDDGRLEGEAHRANFSTSRSMRIYLN